MQCRAVQCSPVQSSAGQCSPVQASAVVDIFLLPQPGPHPALSLDHPELRVCSSSSGLAPPELTSVLDWAGRYLTESSGKIVFFISFLPALAVVLFVFLPAQSCVLTTLRTGGQASDQCRIYRSFSCQSWPEVGRLLILCHAAPHSGDASQQSGCSIMSSLTSIPGLLWGNFLPWLPTLWLVHNPLGFLLQLETSRMFSKYF